MGEIFFQALVEDSVGNPIKMRIEDRRIMKNRRRVRRVEELAVFATEGEKDLVCRGGKARKANALSRKKK